VDRAGVILVTRWLIAYTGGVPLPDMLRSAPSAPIGSCATTRSLHPIDPDRSNEQVGLISGLIRQSRTTESTHEPPNKGHNAAIAPSCRSITGNRSVITRAHAATNASHEVLIVASVIVPLLPASQSQFHSAKVARPKPHIHTRRTHADRPPPPPLTDPSAGLSAGLATQPPA
jgi:hypothetical protein